MVQKKTAVLLDVGGILLLPSHDAVYHALSLIGFEPAKSLIDRAHYYAIRAADKASEEQAAYWYWRECAAALRVPTDQIEHAVDAFSTVFTPGARTWTQPVEESVDGLRLLRAAGARVALVSNSYDSLEADLRNLGICQVGKGAGADVDAIIVSSVVGIEKPDRGIFEIALHALRAEPSEAIHVGDSVRSDVDGAISAGVEAVHFDPLSLCGEGDHHHIASLRDLMEMASGVQ